MHATPPFLKRAEPGAVPAREIYTSRRVFNFVGWGKPAVLLALLIVVAGAWHYRVHEARLGSGGDVYIALGAVLGLGLYSYVRFPAAIALAAAVPVALDALLVLALLALFQHRLDLGCTAALLVVVGYSWVGKLFMLQRMTHNLGNARAGQPLSLSALVNVSVREALSRTRYVLLAVVLVAGSACLTTDHNLQTSALVLAAGLLAGTASSLFIASALWLTLQQRRARTVVPTRYRAALDSRAFLAALSVLGVAGLSGWFWLPV